MRKIHSAMTMMIALSSITLASCSRETEGRTSALTPCQSKICSLVRNVGGDHQKFMGALQEISNEISGLPNANDRLVHYRLLAKELIAFDFDGLSLAQRELMSDKYTPPFYGLIRSMVREGAEEREIGDLIVKTFEKFRTLCYPTNLCPYAENDHSLPARQQRTYAKGLSSRWENDTSVWELVYIPHVFDMYSQDSTQQFLVRWHEKFGCHDKRHQATGKMMRDRVVNGAQ